MHDLVLRGGTVVDPSAGLSAVADVAVVDGRITEIDNGLTGRVVLDATGCVVAPGFIDLHSHSQSVAGHRLQAHDGVTSSLDLEAGVASVATAYAQAAAEGRPLHYGYSASWAASRMSVLADVPRDGTLTTMLAHLGDERWQRSASPVEQDALMALLEEDLAAGALGIGLLIGYNPEATTAEVLRVAAQAAAAQRPVYVHARDLIEFSPSALMDGAEELVRAAGETGAHMHYCHVNSTSLRHVDRVLGLIDRAQTEGSTITTEAYPYGAGSTAIGAAFLTPERLAERSLKTTDLVYLATGERIANDERLLEVRAQDPGGLAIVHFLDEDNPADLSVLLRPLAYPDACIASDAMPLHWTGEVQDDLWPLPSHVVTHPRTAGTFARSYRRLVREFSLLDVTEFVRRASTLPGQILGGATNGAVTKGTLARGCDADVVVFDPGSFADTATYESPTLLSTGVRHLLVAGRALIRDGVLDLDVRSGRPIRSAD